MNAKNGLALMVIAMVVFTASEAMARQCPCDCYFSGDCNPGMFCDYGNLGNEDTCFWRLPKPQGNVGTGCDEIFNDWGQCDGACTPSTLTQVFTFEDPETLAAGISLWGQAVNAASNGGGLPDADIVNRIHNLPYQDPDTVNRLGKIVIELMMITRGEKSLSFPGFEGFQSDDIQFIDVSGDACKMLAGNVVINALVAEIGQRGSGGMIMNDLPTACLQRSLMQRICMNVDDPAGCIYQRVVDFGDVLARSGRESSTGGVAGGAGCNECTTDGDCDDGDPCTLDTCNTAEGYCESTDYIPPCDGVGCNDCNNNGLDDQCEGAEDCNGNGIPDDCEANPQCSTDACQGAADLCPGTAGGTTQDATNDGSANCGNSGSSPDKWYVYTPAANGTLTVTSCGSGYDTVLSIHTGCPGTSSNQVACNDDTCGLQSSVTTSVTAGESYYVRIAGYNGSTGPFTLNVTGPDCDLEEPLAAPAVAAVGSRYLSITPAADSRPVALNVSSQLYPCVNGFVDPATGSLSDIPTYLTPAEWSTISVRDDLIVPDTAYTVTASTNTATSSPAAFGSTWKWADANNNDYANFEDVLLLVQGFQQQWQYVDLESADIEPCTPDQAVTFADIQLGVKAFQGDTFEDTICNMPCAD
ncbi:MAG: hypothetical protein ACYTHJ_10340 [Planctomycetota bacterium]|jgi:hypothetical protein